MSDCSPAPRWPARAETSAIHIYTLLLWLCPRDFREAHGTEVTQVFRQLYRDAWAEDGAWGALSCFTVALGDLALGALEEYIALWWGMWNRSWVMYRMRSSAILVFCAYIAFVVVGMGFQKSSEDVVKSSIPTAHPGVALAYNAVIAGAVIALLATLVGGLPIAFAALRQAFVARRWGIVALFAVPPISLAIWLGWTFTLLDVIFPSRHTAGPTTTLDFTLIYSWVALFIVAAIASAAAVSTAIARSEIRPELFRFALAPEIGVALGMIVSVVALGAWSAQLLNYAPNSLTTRDGPVGFNAPMGAHLIADLVVMSLATLIVIAAIARGFSARRLNGAVA